MQNSHELHSPDARHARVLRTAVILVCFFLSGACGLLYEVVWIRLLVLELGATSLAISTVVAAFMAGLALGSYVFGKVVDRLGRELLFYALLEAAIGVYALLVPAIFAHMRPLYQAAYGMLGGSAYAFGLLKFVLAFAVLVAPAAFMGGTLPVLGRYCTDRRSQVAGRVGFLYGLNTLGATLGAFLTGFVLLPRLGMAATTASAASANIALATLAFLVWIADAAARRRGAKPAAPAEAREPGEAPMARPLALSLTLLAFGVSGFCGMVYEIAWARVLELVIGSSVYGVTTILVTFLLGIALGSFVCSRVARGGWARPFHLGVLLVFIGISAFATMLLFRELPYWFLTTFKLVKHNYDLVLLANFALSMAVMLLPTLLMGMTFPIVVGIYTRDVSVVGGSVGEAYCVNTVGAILGSFAAGFVLLPLLGVQTTILVAIAADVAMGLGLVLQAADCRPRTKRLVAAAVVVFAVSAPVSLPEWNSLLMSSGVYNYAEALNMIPRAQLRAIYGGQGDKLLYNSEGMTCTVCVAERRNGERYMRLNGKVDAATGDLPTNILFAHLGLLFRPAAKNAFVVGYGSGVTSGSALCYPLRTLVCAEIEPKVVEAAALFNDINLQPLSDPRLEVKFCDARNSLLMSDRTFDVIISEPSNPWITGVSNLFTKDFFELAARRLAKDGVFCQWIQVYCLSQESVRSILATFRSVFPHVLVWAPEEGNLIVTGSRKPLALDAAALAKAMSQPRVAKDLARIGIRRLPDLLSRFVMGPREVEALLKDGAVINTDDNAYIEFAAPRTLYHHTIDANLNMARKAGRGALVRNLVNAPKPKAKRARLFLDVAQAYDRMAWRREALALAAYANSMAETARGRRLQGALQLAQGNPGAAEAQWRRALELDSTDAEALARLADLLVGQKRHDEGVSVLAKLLALAPQDVRARYLKGVALKARGKLAEAAEEFRIARQQPGASAKEPRIFYMMGLCLKEQGQYDEAAKNLKHYLELAPKAADARYALGSVYDALGKPARAREQWQLAVAASRRQSVLEFQRGRAAMAGRKWRLAEQHLRTAIDMDCTNVDAHVELARLMEARGRGQDAVSVYERLLGRFPDMELAHLRLGTLYAAEGQKAKAASHFRECLRLEADAERRASIRARLAAVGE